MDTTAQKQKHRTNREAAEINILSGRDTRSRDFLLCKYSKLLSVTGQIPPHVEMYRTQIEENVLIEPPPQGVPEPSDSELFELQNRWGPLDQRDPKNWYRIT